MVIVLAVVLVEKRIIDNIYLETEAAPRAVLGISILVAVFFMKNENAHLVFQR